MSTVYDVLINLRSQGGFDAPLANASKHASALDKATSSSNMSATGILSSFGKLGGMAGSLASSMSGMFTGAVESAASLVSTVAKLGAVAVGGAMVAGVVGLNKELENTQISLAAIFGANGVTKNMNEGMGLAATTMAQMRRDAAALPGETKDLVQIFRMASVPGFQAGASVDQLRKLSASAMAVGATMSMPMDQVARETAMLLQGRAGGHNVLGMNLGITAEGFNKKSAPERLARVQAELDKFTPAIEQFSHSWEGLTSTFRDTAKKLLSDATFPLFNRIKDVFADANGYLDQNADKLGLMANIVGGKLVSAFDIVTEKIGDWGSAFAKFASNVESRLGGVFDKLGNVVGRLMDGGMNFLGSPESIDKILGALKLYAAIKVGGPLLGAAGGISGAATQMGGGATKMAMGFGMTASEAGPIGAAVAFGVLSNALAALAVLGVSVAGAVHSLTDETSAFHVRAVNAWNAIRDNVGNAMIAISSAADALTPAAIAVSDAMGSILLSSLNNVAAAAASAAGFISTVANSLASFGARLGLGGGGNTQIATAATETVAFSAIENGLAKGMSAVGKTKAGGGGGGGGTHVAKVEIVVNSNEDPSRIARRTFDLFADRMKNPVSSRYVPSYSGGR